MKSPRIARALADPTADPLSLGSPLIEPWDAASRLVTFLWRGQATRLRAWWSIDVPMSRVPETDLWVGSSVFPSDLRTTYCFEKDGAQQSPQSLNADGPAFVDPLNPVLVHFPADPDDPDDTQSWKSILTLPDAPPEPWLRPPARPGSVTPATLWSSVLGRQKSVAVYRPHGVSTAGLPVLVVFDGFLTRRAMRIPDILDNLLEAGEILPFVGLFVSNLEATRDDELSPAPSLGAFVAGELLPWARTTLGAGERGNIVAGVSRGGLAAAYLGLHHPSSFGAVIAHSGSFWWPSPDVGEPGWLIRSALRKPPSGVHFYLDVGTLETRPGPSGAPTQLFANRAMRDALRDRGNRVTYTEYTGAHDYINWRRTFADAMIAVAGVPSGSPAGHAAQKDVAGAGPAAESSRR
jgi:enterochelin esterase family protein